MTANKRSERRHCRYWLRRVVWRWNLLLATLALLAVVWLAQAGVASAAPRCPGGTATPHGCSYELPGMTCAWPLRLVQVGLVAYCWRPAPEVQP